MHKFAQKLALTIVGISEMNEISEMVSYSLEAIITSTITALSGLIIAIYFHCTAEFFIYSLCFITVRMRHKSFHFKKFILCYISSNIMIIVCTLIIKHYNFSSILIPCFFILISLFYYISIEKNYIEIILIAIVFTLSLYINKVFSLSIFLSIFTNTILILGRTYHEKINVQN